MKPIEITLFGGTGLIGTFLKDAFGNNIKSENFKFSKITNNLILTGKVKIKLEEGIQSNKILRLKGKGLPSVNSYGHGDLLVHINVWTPQTLSKEEKKFFEESKESENFAPSPTGTYKSFFDRLKEMFG